MTPLMKKDTVSLINMMNDQEWCRKISMIKLLLVQLKYRMCFEVQYITLRHELFRYITEIDFQTKIRCLISKFFMCPYNDRIKTCFDWKYCLFTLYVTF